MNRNKRNTKIGLGDYGTITKLKEEIEIILFHEPLHFAGLYRKINASKYCIQKAVYELMLESKLFRVGFVEKEKLNLKDHLNYFSTNYKLHHQWKK